MENGFFLKMCKDAQEELTCGNKGWKEVEPNTLILACFGFLMSHLTKKLSKPLWFFASSVFAAVVGYIINIIISVD